MAEPLRCLLGAALALGLAACHPLARSVAEAELVGDDAWIVVTCIDVPEVEGPAGCGAQALAAVMAYDEGGADAAALGAALPWHADGATPVDMLLEARSRGHAARIEAGTIERLLQEAGAGRPSLVMIDVAPVWPTLTGGLPMGRSMHWGVVSGTRLDGTKVLLAAPESRHHVVTAGDFLERWSRADRCLITIGPGESE